MARVTRSKKINIAEDQTALAPPIEPSTEAPTALAELDTEEINAMETDEATASELKGLKAAFRNTIGGGRKKGKGRKKKADAIAPEVALPREYVILEDKNVITNAASEEVRELLQSFEGTNPVVEERPPTPPSPAVRATRRQMAKLQATEAQALLAASAQELLAQIDIVPTLQEASNPQLDKENQTPTEEVVSIETPVKSPTKTLDIIIQQEAPSPPASNTPLKDLSEDSFVEQIIARSPAKPVSRIEDSIEALDQDEEALFAIDQVAFTNHIISPEIAKPTSKHVENRIPSDTMRRIQNKHVTLEKNVATNSKKPGYASMRVKSTIPREPVLQRAKSMILKESKPGEPDNCDGPATKPVRRPRPTSLLPPKQPVKSTKPVTRPTFELPGEAIARKLKEQREERVARMAARSDENKPIVVPTTSAPKIRSAKPLTKPAFELPGEAISRRKREAQEVRVKAEEEEERKRREFKAKPVRIASGSNVPKDTVASRARQSKVGTEAERASKRLSVVGAHRPSLQQARLANTSAPRSPVPSISLTRNPSTASNRLSTIGSSLQRAGSQTETQRQRVKDIYGRSFRLEGEIEKEKKEREEATKRARVEFAESGRLASREWAAKRQAKMAGGAAKPAIVAEQKQVEA